MNERVDSAALVRAAAEAAPVTVVLVDDHPVLRDGLRLLFRSEGHVVLGESGSPGDAYELVATRRPCVAVVDLVLRTGSGLELTERLVRDFPELAVVIYTGVSAAETLSAAVRSRAHGVVRKSASPEALLEAVQRVAAGGNYVDPHLMLQLDGAAVTAPVLSPRQQEILSLLAHGATGPQIAAELVVSVETVKTHIRNAMERLEATTRVHAIVRALERGEIRAPGP